MAVDSESRSKAAGGLFPALAAAFSQNLRLRRRRRAPLSQNLAGPGGKDACTPLLSCSWLQARPEPVERAPPLYYRAVPGALCLVGSDLDLSDMHNPRYFL